MAGVASDFGAALGYFGRKRTTRLLIPPSEPLYEPRKSARIEAGIAVLLTHGELLPVNITLGYFHDQEAGSQRLAARDLLAGR